MGKRESIKVLIAEDDHLVGEVIKALLRELNYTVIGEAADGLEAVEMAQSLQPDVVLMDIEMPEMDGLGAARLIRERCPTPVVVLTAYEMEERVQEASAAGVGAYLLKPPNAREIERAITIAIARFDDMMALRQSHYRLEDTMAELEETMTELEETRAKVIKQERLAAVGQLSAGIAHDFRSLLTSIILYAQLSLRYPDLSPKLVRNIETIIGESKKIAGLVQQILDFGRRAILRIRVLNLQDLVQGLMGTLQRTVSENVRLSLDVEPGQQPDAFVVRADAERIQQALDNLTANARDAMPEGGELRLGLSHVEVTEDKAPPVADMEPGSWVCLTVSDTGTGMTDEVREHLFEPFFTTKEVGQGMGLGLGLAQVYGIVRQHEGFIDAETEWGQGTTLRIYLPAYVDGDRASVADSDRASVE